MFVIKNLHPESKKELQLKSHALSRRSPSPPYATSANTSTPITTNNAAFKHAPLNLRYLPTKRVLTDKVTNNPFPKHINTNQQHEHFSARERYVHAIYSQNTLQCPTKEIIHVKPITTTTTTPNDVVKSQRDLTSNDIVCRDMYSNCDVNAYRFRRAKSMYINRSYCYRDDNNNNNNTTTINNNNDSDINSRKRKILNMTSDIFFTESSDNPINKDKSLLYHQQHKKIVNLKLQHNNNMNNGGSSSNNNNNNNCLSTTTNITKHTLNNMHSIHNRNPMNFYTKTNAPVIKKQIIHSKYSPQCNWQLMNIEAAVKRSKTVEPRMKTLYRRKSFCTKTNDRDHELFNYYNNNNNDNTSKDNSNVNGSATPRPHCKHLLASMKGMNSVKYNIISPGRLNSDRSYRYKPAEDTAFSNIDYYEIECGDKFNKMNTGLLKNTFYSEGIHIFKFEEKTNLLNGKTQGRFTFKVRKGENQKEFNDKMEKIENKLKMKDLKLVKKGGETPCYKPT